MKTVQITEAAAIQAYKAANQEGKNLLENLIGKQLFNQKITDRIKTFEDALAIVGATDNQKTLLDYNGNDPFMIACVADLKLSIITKVLNEGWEPNWDDSNQRKWRPWFYLNSPGFRFADACYDYTVSNVGSRFCFKSEELCVYAAKQFLTIYKDLFN